MLVGLQDKRATGPILYLGIWGSLGAAAIAAIAVLALWPETESAAPAAQHAPARLAEEVARLTGRLDRAEQRERTATARLAGVEERLAIVEARALPKVQASGIVSGSIPQSAPPAPVAVGTGPPKAAPPIALTPPAVRAATLKAARHAVRLARAPDLEALRLTWSLLSERHRALLGSLEGRYTGADGGPGKSFQLIAGPLDAPAAERVCKELAWHGIDCAPAAFAGSAL